MHCDFSKAHVAANILAQAFPVLPSPPRLIPVGAPPFRDPGQFDAPPSSAAVASLRLAERRQAGRLVGKHFAVMVARRKEAGEADLIQPRPEIYKIGGTKTRAAHSQRSSAPLPFFPNAGVNTLSKQELYVGLYSSFSMVQVNNRNSMKAYMCIPDVNLDHVGPVLNALVDKYGEGVSSLSEFVAAINNDNTPECPQSVKKFKHSYKQIRMAFPTLSDNLIHLEREARKRDSEAVKEAEEKGGRKRIQPSWHNEYK